MVSCDRCHRKFPSYAALRQHYGDRHSNAKWPDELESRLTAEKEAETFKANLHPSRQSHSKLIIAIVLVLIIAGAVWYYVSASSSNPSLTNTGDPTLSICLTDSTTLAEHIHPNLQIVINGQPVTIPTDTGITPTCQRPIHTHDDSGTIHVESPVVYPFTVHDFFLVWGHPFDSTHILQYQVDSTHKLTMTVNGAPNTQFQNYVMKDGDQIVIKYGA